MKFANATKFYRKSGAAEGSAVPRTFPGNVFRQQSPATCFMAKMIVACVCKQRLLWWWQLHRRKWAG